jgi:SAM-dependent methyltransferase
VSACPACGATDRRLLHAELHDEAFRVAPGAWTLWACGRCGSAYLDPRPTRDTIGRAYARYYTHEEAAPARASAGRESGLKARLAAGYRNARFGTDLRPALSIGALVGRLDRRAVRALELQYRFLPKREGTARVLDVGCGNGAWLSRAAELGWEPHGLDFDGHAVDQARRSGFEVVEGGLDKVLERRQWYDAVTLSHVIEHLHDPAEALAEVLHLLAPGGMLFLETPNVNSLAHRLYGRHWRGLEPPRHIQIFSRNGLRKLLGRLGYTRVRSHRVGSPFQDMARQSAMLAQGLDPGTTGASWSRPTRPNRLRAAFDPRVAEILVLTAEKPR